VGARRPEHDLNASMFRTWLCLPMQRVSEVVVMRRLVTLLGAALVASSIGLAAPALAQADSVSIDVVGTPTQDVPLTVKVSGKTEVTRRLFVFINAKYGCYGTSSEELSGARTNGDGITSLTPEPVSGESGEALSTDSYSKEYTYTPPETGTYTVCGYIDEVSHGYGTLDATGTTSFTIAPLLTSPIGNRGGNPIPAGTKTEEERQAKEKYEAEAPAREAAKEAAEEAKRAAELAAAEAKAHETPVKRLSVKPVAHARHSSTDPGYTNLM
jgi:hypothetical protein